MLWDACTKCASFGSSVRRVRACKRGCAILMVWFRCRLQGVLCCYCVCSLKCRVCVCVCLMLLYGRVGYDARTNGTVVAGCQVEA